MASGFFVVVVAVILLQIGTGKDIKWIRNSNWDSVDNWELGRLPCKGDIASFTQVKPIDGKIPMVYFNANSTVRKLVLPRNSKIVLKRSITIRLSANQSCEVDANAVPIVAGQVNNFIGVRTNKWECKSNWRTVDDNSAVDNAPCGSDVAVFPSDSAFSYVTSDVNVFVKSVLIRSHKPSNLDDYQNEFLLGLTINAGCRDDADSCLCIPVDSACNIVPTSTPTTSVPNVGVSPSVSVPNPFPTGSIIGPVNTGGVVQNTPGGSDGGSSSAGAVVGAVIGVIVILIIVAIVIIAVIVIRKRRYIKPKHEPLEEDFPPAAKESGSAAYDNPTYDIDSTDPMMDQLVPRDASSYDNPLYQ
ncbi:uncharacterized protein [Dysidea avara]|uniref:uncharacterized protein isoform X2 n=1 Tax=Dysidea avara TaxID=196820 RepID=UPI00331E43D6